MAVCCDYKKIGTFTEWLSRDPIAEKGGINLYGYAGNDPINFIDPFGLHWEYNQSMGEYVSVKEDRYILSDNSASKLCLPPFFCLEFIADKTKKTIVKYWKTMFSLVLIIIVIQMGYDFLFNLKTDYSGLSPLWKDGALAGVLNESMPPGSSLDQCLEVYKKHYKGKDLEKDVWEEYLENREIKITVKLGEYKIYPTSWRTINRLIDSEGQRSVHAILSFNNNRLLKSIEIDRVDGFLGNQQLLSTFPRAQ